MPLVLWLENGLGARAVEDGLRRRERYGRGSDTGFGFTIKGALLDI